MNFEIQKLFSFWFFSIMWGFMRKSCRFWNGFINISHKTQQQSPKLLFSRRSQLPASSLFCLNFLFNPLFSSLPLTCETFFQISGFWALETFFLLRFFFLAQWKKLKEALCWRGITHTVFLFIRFSRFCAEKLKTLWEKWIELMRSSVGWKRVCWINEKKKLDEFKRKKTSECENNF